MLDITPKTYFIQEKDFEKYNIDKNSVTPSVLEEIGLFWHGHFNCCVMRIRISGYPWIGNYHTSYPTRVMMRLLQLFDILTDKCEPISFINGRDIRLISDVYGCIVGIGHPTKDRFILFTDLFT